jgi:hypothetical protein
MKKHWKAVDLAFNSFPTPANSEKATEQLCVIKAIISEHVIPLEVPTSRATSAVSALSTSHSPREHWIWPIGLARVGGQSNSALETCEMKSAVQQPCGQPCARRRRSVCTVAGISCKAGEAAEGWLEIRGNAHPVHSTVQNPFEDAMAQRGRCGQSGALHNVVGGGPCDTRSACAQGCWGIGSHRTDTQAIPQCNASLTTLELVSSCEGQVVEPS